jgi:hypothetical protein
MKPHEFGALAYLHSYVNITCTWQLRVGDHQDVTVGVHKLKLAAW